MKQTVAIIGVGLIGGSLGQALRRSGRYRVLGMGRHRRSLQEARRCGAIDRASTHWPDVAQASIVVVATPVHQILPMIKRILPFLRPGTWVTDVGSLKAPLVDGFRALGGRNPVFFVGGHPLAGSHKTGVKAARPDLFKGSTCVLVPVGRAPVKPVQDLWRAAGAGTVILSARVHDRAVALISHLPHVLAHTLVHLVASHPDRKILMPLLAGSFRDMTRVASSDPDQWFHILQGNAANVQRALREFKRELACLEKHLKQRQLKTLLRQSQTFRLPLFMSGTSQ